MGIVCRLTLLIGARFHSLVFAAAATVPMFAISYDPKVSGFVKSIGQSQFLCELDSLTFEDFKEKVDLILANKKAVTNILHEEKLKLQKEARMNVMRMNNIDLRS